MIVGGTEDLGAEGRADACHVSQEEKMEELFTATPECAVLHWDCFSPDNY